MLLLPNLVYQLFAAGPTQHPSGAEQGDQRQTDIEKEPRPDSSQTSERKCQETENLFKPEPSASRRRPVGFTLGGYNLNLSSNHDLPSGDDQNPTYRTLPIISGILIPFSILLSIPSLTGHWYIRTTNDVTVETRPNPLLLDIGMGLSMGCGVLANICLVVRFAERSVKKMTLLCIIFLTLHDLINIPAITIFGIQHRFDDGFTYGQSFWMTVCSTIASTATNITLIVDCYRTVDFKNSGSGLTHKQRSLVIIIIVLLCYIALGSAIQTVMLHINFIDALYFTVVSIETIGFGDLHPVKTGARIFTSFYIALGILNLAVAVALSREALLEAAAVGFQARLKAVRVRQRDRRMRSRWRAAVKWRLRAKKHPLWVTDERVVSRGQIRHRHWWTLGETIWHRLWKQRRREWEDPAWRYVYGPSHKRLNLEALTEAQLEAAALEAGAPLMDLLPRGLLLSGHPITGDDAPRGRLPVPEVGNHPPPLTHMRMGGMIFLMGRFAFAHTHGQRAAEQLVVTGPTDDGEGEESTYNGEGLAGPSHGVPFTHSFTMQDDESFAESLEDEERIAFIARLSVAWLLFIVFWMAGSALFMKTEGWDFGSAAYFCFIAFTTVGYGDLAPRTPAGRSIFVVWALLGVATMTVLISIVAEAYSNQYKSVIRSQVFQDSVSTVGDASATRQRLLESRTALNTTTEQDYLSPLSATSLMPYPSPNSFMLGQRRPRPNMISMPEAELNTQRPAINDLDTLAQEILRHAQNLQILTNTTETPETQMPRLDPADLPSTSTTIFPEMREDDHRKKREEYVSHIEKTLQDIIAATSHALEIVQNSFDYSNSK
ncbi:hypothetical protein B0H34DRAFT_475992 [Crassisporium funariophilum]|nr:hypothetical protein B0H34DRAFT_475992 [Crassisporium funariophilum]